MAGMAAGADSIDDMDVLRHGAMGELFGGVRAPSTLGSFLRSFTWGNVRQLDAVARRLLAELAGRAPLLPGAGVLAFIDMDSMQKRVYGHAKQGAGFGHTKIQGKGLLVRGLNALAAVISTPLAAPVIAATRLRGGSANSARGAASLATEAISAARASRVHRPAGVPYRLGVLLRRGAGLDPRWRGVLLGHRADGPQDPRRDRVNPRGRLDPGHLPARGMGRGPGPADLRRRGRRGDLYRVRLEERQGDHRPADRPPGPRPELQAPAGQDELFACWRYHAVFTDSPFEMIQAEAQHRGHAIIEQVFADWNDGPLAHLPSGRFPANAAWLALAAIDA